MKFETRRYVASHGKEPRGQGWWGFRFLGAPEGQGEVFFMEGTLTECRKKIRSSHPWVKFVEVLP